MIEEESHIAIKFILHVAMSIQLLVDILLHLMMLIVFMAFFFMARIAFYDAKLSPVCASETQTLHTYFMWLIGKV